MFFFSMIFHKVKVQNTAFIKFSANNSNNRSLPLNDKYLENAFVAPSFFTILPVYNKIKADFDAN